MYVVAGQESPEFIYVGSKSHPSARSLRLAIDALLLCALVWSGLVVYTNYYQPVVAVSVNAVTRTVATTATPTAVSPSAIALKPKAAVSPSATLSQAAQCTPDHSYQPAGALALSASTPGLHTVIETPHYYRVYGDTSAVIRQQIIRCAPTQFIGAGEAYSGQTDFWMGWSYNYAQTATSCHVTAVAVGLHVTQTYPEWQPTASTQPGLAAQWQTFIAHLKTHEQGHVSLGEQYAQAMLNDIQSMSAPSCSSLMQAVNSRANQEAAALNAANASYDVVTSHGATQGAVLP